jgi:O-antigen/teichoic acid export membrane protein
MSEAVPDHDPAIDLLDRPEAGGTAIRGVAIRTLLFGAGLLLNLASVPFMVRHLGPVQYGYYITVSSIVFIIGAVTEAGLTNLGVRYWAAADHRQDRRELMRNLVGLRVLLTSAGLLIAGAVCAAAGARPIVIKGVFVYGLGLLVSMVAYTYAVPLTASLRLGTTSFLDFLRQALLAGGTLALVAAGASLLPFFALWVIVSGIVVVITAVIVRGEMSVRPAFHWPTWGRFVREAITYSLASAVGLVYFRVAMVLIAFLSTDLEAGYYATAFRIVEVATNLPWLLVSSVFPILARAATTDMNRLRYAAQRIVEVSVMVGGWMTLCLVAGARLGIDVIGGLPEFQPSVVVLQLQALTLVSTFLVAAWSLVLLSLHEHRALLRANLVALAVAVVAAVVLIPPLGARGGAITTVVAETVLAAAYYVALRRSHPELAVSMEVLPRIALAIAAAAAASFVPAPDVVQVALVTLVYAGVLLAMRAVPEELWHALRSRRMA